MPTSERETPYHEGELAAQERAGETDQARMNAGVIARYIPPEALAFIADQPMLIAGSLDRNGRVWASILTGEPGFLGAENDRALVLDTSRPLGIEQDPLWENLRQDPRIGLLFIEPANRRRLRVNGRARAGEDAAWRIEVDAAYVNCPKYIQRRYWRRPSEQAMGEGARSRQGTRLAPHQQDWIAGSDTLFVASAHPGQGVDASHRGGRPGFVRLQDDRRLRIPDYAGNSMFNTLGNFASYPYAGVTFVDFERGRVLLLSGRAQVFWDAEDARGETGGTGRFWELTVESWREGVLPFALEWEFLDYSPFIPRPTDGDADDEGPLRLQVAEVREEAGGIKRFRMQSAAGAELPPFQPGAHLPVSVRLPNGVRAQRHYSILSDPGERHHYEIAVLAEPKGGGGSLYMHEEVRAGQELEAETPRSSFSLAEAAEHSILIAGGIGITPILSMLRALQAEGRSYELHYSARRASDLVFREVIEAMAGERARFYASRDPGGRRLPLEQLLRSPAEGAHVYICGPRRMIIAAREAAEREGWLPGQVHFESFGASPGPDDRAVSVRLARSGTTVPVPADQTILDALLERGHGIPHDCKRGECSLCATRFLEGAPDHRDLCLSPAERAGVMCICVSRALGDTLELDL